MADVDLLVRNCGELVTPGPRTRRGPAMRSCTVSRTRRCWRVTASSSPPGPNPKSFPRPAPRASSSTPAAAPSFPASSIRTRTPCSAARALPNTPPDSKANPTSRLRLPAVASTRACARCASGARTSCSSWRCHVCAACSCTAPPPRDQEWIRARTRVRAQDAARPRRLGPSATGAARRSSAPRLRSSSAPGARNTCATSWTNAAGCGTARESTSLLRTERLHARGGRDDPTCRRKYGLVPKLHADDSNPMGQRSSRVASRRLGGSPHARLRSRMRAVRTLRPWRSCCRPRPSDWDRTIGSGAALSKPAAVALASDFNPDRAMRDMQASGPGLLHARMTPQRESSPPADAAAAVGRARGRAAGTG